MAEIRALSTIIASSNIDLAISGWLDSHKKSAKTYNAYKTAIQQVCEKYLGTHAHVTRHTFTYLMIKAGATLPEIQARLGHESLATTGTYAGVLTSHENPHADTLAKMLGFE